MATYYLSLTDHGAAALAAAQAGGPSIQISHLVLGDANGQPYQPSSATSRTTLVHQLASLPVLSVAAVDDLVTVDTLVPASVGGFAIHEIGLTDAAGQLLYIGNWTGGYKPVLAEGGAGDMQFRLELLTSGLPTVVIVSDPNNVTATRQWALDHFVLQTVFDAHVTQNALEHDNLLAMIQTLNELIAAQAEELMSTQFSILQQAIADLTDRIAAIESIPAVQPIQIGGLLITTIAYADAAAVAAGEGYGTWVRHAEGQALVGLSDNAPDPAWTKTIGSTFGEYEHALTVGELAAHTHTEMDEETDTVYPVFGPAYGVPNGPVTLRTLDSAKETIADGYALQTGATGSNQAHNNVQPSIVIGIWRRTA